MSQEVLEVVQKNQFMDFVVPKIIAVRSVSLLKIDWLKNSERETMIQNLIWGKGFEILQMIRIVS